MSSGTKTGPAGGTGTAAGTGGDAAPEAGPRTGTDTAGDVRESDVRERIDELDRRIIALVQERRAVSAGTRRTPAGAGAGRSEDASRSDDGGLAREMEILKRYRHELGRPGTQLAMTLLSLSRSPG